MRIGVTGTRSGMTEYQKKEVTTMLAKFGSSNYLHHGDCVGVDVEVAQIARELGYHIICHPPEKDDLRGFFYSDSYELPKSYFARNRDIVDSTDFLFVVPYQMEWQLTTMGLNGEEKYEEQAAGDLIQNVDVELQDSLCRP
jgi:hypothetical protein